MLATALTAAFGARQIGQRSDELLTERAAGVAATIDRRVDTYLEKLFGVRGLFEVEGAPSRRQFETYLAGQRVQQRFPGALSFGFAEAVPLQGRSAFVDAVDADARASGLPYPPFTIRPNAERPLSVVVTFTSPVRGLERAYGFDLLSEASRRTAVENARDTARPTATAPLRLVTEQGTEARGVLILLPVYRGDTQTPPSPVRAERFRGAAYAALRLPDLMRGITEEGDDLEVYDVGSAEALPARLRAGDEAFNLRGGADAPTRDADESRVMELTTAGRRWSVYFRPGASLVGGGERAVPWLIGGFGLLVSLLAGGVVQALSTSRRRAQALADEMTVELQRSNEELERFAFLASHDLQQPLRTVSGFLQLLEHQMGERLDETAREYIAQSLRGTRQMSTLIDDLLRYSRVSRSDAPLTPVRLDDAWDAAVDQLAATIEDSGAKVSRGDLPVVAGDPGQLVQVFANLIGNAVKYRAEAPPEVRADARRVNGAWEIAVTDNGIGIDSAHHGRIFEMFRRLHGEGEVEGTGVGLALVKRILERSGGDIRVQSELGHGSRFIVVLPPLEAEGRGR
jgi:signal transduction histidine kinase